MTGARNNLAEQVLALATMPPPTYAIMYQTPDGEYRLSGPDGLTGSPRNRYVISVDQLRKLRWELGITPDDLTEGNNLYRLAAAVAERR
jgi:hypothetical protein